MFQLSTVNARASGDQQVARTDADPGAPGAIAQIARQGPDLIRDGEIWQHLFIVAPQFSIVVRAGTRPEIKAHLRTSGRRAGGQSILHPHTDRRVALCPNLLHPAGGVDQFHFPSFSRRRARLRSNPRSPRWIRVSRRCPSTSPAPPCACLLTTEREDFYAQLG